MFSGSRFKDDRLGSGLVFNCGCLTGDDVEMGLLSDQTDGLRGEARLTRV